MILALAIIYGVIAGVAAMIGLLIDLFIWGTHGNDNLTWPKVIRDSVLFGLAWPWSLGKMVWAFLAAYIHIGGK